MSLVAVYSMKGGVGKTTTAVNLAYMAAAEGRRVLLWDLDPQAAASFAFRVQPRVAGFGRKLLERGQTLAAAIKATDYDHLDLLPADFAYRKLDRLLHQVGSPRRVMTAILEVLGRDYDVVVVDCPAGLSLANEGVLAAADAVLVPTIPTTLSLRTLARILKWADRTRASFALAAFFSMVDRRKSLHRRTCEWLSGHHDLFLAAHVPYASIVEEMAVRRLPLPLFASRDAATLAFAGIWAELQARVRAHHARGHSAARWADSLRDIETLIANLEAMRGQGATPRRSLALPSPAGDEVHFVHRFDTEGRDLARRGYRIELQECRGRLLLVAVAAGERRAGESDPGAVQALVDSAAAAEVLSGVLSPLAALEARLGQSGASCLARVREIVGARRLRLVESVEASSS
jgi:cellulose biosynthesis protein BcsQ